MTAPAGWDGILDPGEEILWQGRPEPGLTITGFQPIPFLMGLFFMGFSLFWMKTAAQAGGFFWMFGLIFFAVGFYNSIGTHIWRAILRGRAHYTLTDKRAFIATDVFGRKSLRFHDIEEGTPLDYDGKEPATIWFGPRTSFGGIANLPAAFERVSPGREIYAKVRDVQRRLA